MSVELNECVPDLTVDQMTKAYIVPCAEAMARRAQAAFPIELFQDHIALGEGK